MATLLLLLIFIAIIFSTFVLMKIINRAAQPIENQLRTDYNNKTLKDYYGYYELAYNIVWTIGCILAVVVAIAMFAKFIKFIYVLI